MGSRRQHVFVLLFVLGLVALSAIVIATKETKLGLDLQGGLQLVYEGQPTGTNTEVSGEDIEDSINIIEKRIIDGQLKECDLTMRELEVVAESFRNTLQSMMHSHIAYPEDRPTRRETPIPMSKTKTSTAA